MLGNVNHREVKSENLGLRRRRVTSDIAKTQVSSEFPHTDESTDRISLLHSNNEHDIQNAPHESTSSSHLLTKMVIRGGVSNQYNEQMLHRSLSTYSSEKLNGKVDGKRPVARIKLGSRDAHLYIKNDKRSGLIHVTFEEIPETVNSQLSYLDRFNIDSYEKGIMHQVYHLAAEYSALGGAKSPEDIVVGRFCHPDLFPPEKLGHDHDDRQTW